MSKIFLVMVLMSLNALADSTVLPGTKVPHYAGTGKNLEAVRALHIKVFLPTNIPKGYVLFDYQIENEIEKTGWQNYSVMYLKDKSHWFVVNSKESIGDIIVENKEVTTTKGKSALFGGFTFYLWKKSTPEAVTKTRHFITDWLRRAGVPEPKGANPVGDYRDYNLNGYGLSSAEITKVLQSLQPIN